MTNLYDLSVAIIGVLPSQFHFIYGIITLVFSIMLVFVAFSPFFIAYSILKGR